MGTGLETADDYLELLLEFDDSDQIVATETDRKQQPPSESTAKPTRSTPRDSVVLRNSPQQIQAEEQQATEDGDKSYDEEDEETNHPRKSWCNVREGHELLQHSFGEADEQEINEETSNFHEKRSDDAGADCSDEEDPISLKQRFNRDRPDIRYNVEEANDQDREQDVRLLSGIRRNRRASVGGGYESSDDTRGRASKRIRQDESGGTGWDDPIIGGDFAQGGMDCSQRGVPGDERRLQDSPLLSSPGRPSVQEVAKDGQGCHNSGIKPTHPEWDRPLERETSPPVTVLGYKIPGPAGALQNCLNSSSHRSKGLTYIEKYCGPGQLLHMPISASETLDFREGPWLAAMGFLSDGVSTSGNHSLRSTIVTIKSTKQHIPQLVAIINTAVRNGFGDLSVTLKDPTGTIGGTIQRKVLTELEDGHLITPGAVIILRKVAVFSPTPFKHYLNITINNVDQIFGKDTIAPRRRENAVNDKDDLGITGGDHPIAEPGSNDAFRVQTASKEGHVSESIARNFGNSNRQGVTDLTHTLDKDERIQADEAPGSGAAPRKSLPMPTILEDTIDLRKLAVAATGGNPKDPTSELPSVARASQEAIAKAAGWDFSEDAEFLLADDLF